jgi:hypothetical protein
LGRWRWEEDESQDQSQQKALKTLFQGGEMTQTLYAYMNKRKKKTLFQKLVRCGGTHLKTCMQEARSRRIKV